MGKAIADRQWSDPTPDGLTSETRFWIDDMYMLTILRARGLPRHRRQQISRPRRQRDGAYLDKLQQPNGLFYHAPDVPFFWGRGDGWVAAGMTEMLRSLPAGPSATRAHPPRLQADDGRSAQVTRARTACGVNSSITTKRGKNPPAPACSPSRSSPASRTAGSTPTYGPAARKAWIAVTGFIDQNSDVTSVCEGTNKFNSLDYYLARQRRTGDFHGQEPVLWAPRRCCGRVYSRPLSIAAITRGLRRPWITATTHNGFSSGAYAIR